jgi:hypothetical protein
MKKTKSRDLERREQDNKTEHWLAKAEKIHFVATTMMIMMMEVHGKGHYGATGVYMGNGNGIGNGATCWDIISPLGRDHFASRACSRSKRSTRFVHIQAHGHL